jgi:hypothetical protein
MKLRHSNPNLSITSQSRELYRRYAGRGVFLPTPETHLHARKIAIRWHQPRSWPVPVRTPRDLEMADI